MFDICVFSYSQFGSIGENRVQSEERNCVPNSPFVLIPLL